MPNGPPTPSKKRTDSKKSPFFGRFGRKTGVLGQEKNTLFCPFTRFSGFLRLQVVGWQNLPANARLQKKSRLKTYRRFLFLRASGKMMA
jgi:hypothetical protein